MCDGTGVLACRNFNCYVAWIEVSAVSTSPSRVRVCIAGPTFQTIFPVAWSLPIVCDNYRYIYNKLHIHSRKCDCFFPLEIMFCSSYLVSCQGRAPQGPTYRVIYLCPFDHLRTLKMRFLCKIKHLLCEVEYLMKNYHHHRHSYY